MSTSVSYSQADKIKEYYSINFGQSYQFANGLLISASFGRSQSPKPDTDFARLFDYRTESKSLSFNVSYPLIRSRDLNLSIGLGYDHRDAYSYMMADDRTNDRLRTLSFNANFDFSDELGGVTQIITTLSQGLDVFHATNRELEATNALAPAKYFKADIYVSRNQQLPLGFSLFLSGEAMTADRVLASYNKFSLGGGQFGRGYDSGAFEGDRAVAFSFEPRWTYNPAERLSIQPFAFIDYGRVWANQSLVGVPDSEYGSSFGFGLRFWGHVGNEMFPDFNLSGFWGKPMKKLENEKSSRWIFMASFYF
jgi:hemolysin activation/secretion protein